MTSPPTSPPSAVGDGSPRTATVAQQTAALTTRTFLQWRGQPGVFWTNLLFPALVLLMMGGLFGGAIAGSTGDYMPFVVPGVLTLTMLFGLEATMTAMTTDRASTVADRLRSLPAPAAAVLGGRLLADLVTSLLALVAMTLVGLALGWRWDGLAAAAAAYLLLVWLRVALLWVGLWLGLKASGPEAVVAVQILVWPAGFLSTVFLDPATMPSWLGWLAEWNPLSATAEATRELFGNPTVTGTTWAADNALLLAVLWPLLLLVVSAPLAVRSYRRLGD
jgi:ABC transporter DrrB family efflux protein